MPTTRTDIFQPSGAIQLLQRKLCYSPHKKEQEVMWESQREYWMVIELKMFINTIGGEKQDISACDMDTYCSFIEKYGNILKIKSG